MHQDNTLELANIAMATQADRTLITLLTKTIAEFSTEVSTLTAKLATAHSDNACLEKSGNHSAPAKHGHDASINQSQSNQNMLWGRNIYSKSVQKFDPNVYWSTHRFKIEEAHTTTTCCYLGDGHNKLATHMDSKGRKTRNKDRINGGPTEWRGGLLDKYIVNINENILIILSLIINLYKHWMN